MAPRSRVRLAVLTVAGLIAACRNRETSTARPPPASYPSDSPVRTDMPSAPLRGLDASLTASRCTLVPRGGVSLGGHVDAATIAALGEDALVTATEHAPEADGEMHSTMLHQLHLVAGDVREGRVPPSGLAVSGLVPREGDVLTHRGIAVGDGDSLLAAAVSSNDVMLAGWSQRSVVDIAPLAGHLATHGIREPFSADAIAGAARQGLVVLAATGFESLRDGEGLPDPGFRRVFVVTTTTTAASVHVTGTPIIPGTPVTGPRAPAVALAPDARDGGAVAYVTDVGSLRVWRLGADGIPTGSPLEIAHAVSETSDGSASPPRLIGAPAMVFRGRTLIVVWAQRENPTSAFSLRTLEFDPTAATNPPTPETLSTGTASAFAPAIVTRSDAFVIAWMEGDDAHGRVRVGSGATLALAVSNAIDVSAPDVDARDPEIAASDTRTWIIWQEFTHGRRNTARLRGALVECP